MTGRRSLLIPLFLCGLAFVGAPLNVRAAADTCNCYCTSPTGATSEPDATTKIERADCQERCKNKGQSIAAFACTANQHPSRTVKCFTQEQCTDVNGELGKNYQPPECPNGYHYCYADPSTAAKVTLSTSIGGLTITGDLGEYVSKAYIWMVGASTTIAIVFLMVAGLRWALGGLNAEQVGAAKKTIQNALIGLILLLCSYLILATVNPQLLKLKVPSFPLIKTVSLVDNASCDVLIDEGYKVEYSGPEECGIVGTVIKDPDGDNVADGTVCNFSYCPTNSEICVPGEKPTCMDCEELTAGNKTVVPTRSLCAAFNSLDSYVKANTKKNISVEVTVGSGSAQRKVDVHYEVTDVYQACFYTLDPDAGGDGIGAAACAFVAFDCDQITSCEAYDRVQVLTGSSGATNLDNVDLGTGSGLTGSSSSELLMSQAGDFTLGLFCQNSSVADLCWSERGLDSKNFPKACYIDSTQLGLIFSGSILDILSSSSAVEYDCQTADDAYSFWLSIFDATYIPPQRYR